MINQELRTGVTEEYEDISYKYLPLEYLREMGKKLAYFLDSGHVITIDPTLPQSTSCWYYSEPIKKIYINLAPSYADMLNMDDLGSEDLRDDIGVDIIRQQIAKRFAELRQVKVVYLYESADGFEVNTVMKSRHYQSRRCLYAKQLQIHDLYPDIDIDFNVIFTNDEILESDLPEEAIICFSR